MLPSDCPALPAAERRPLSRTCFCRCTSSSRATARWWPTRSTSDRMIGMVLLRPGWERDYEGRPPSIRSAAAASSRTSSGSPTAATTSCCAASSGSGSSRRGPRASAYRRGARRAAARSRPLDAVRADDARGSGAASRRCSAPQPDERRAIRGCPASMSDEDLVNALAQYLDLEPLEKQALLERDGVLERCRSLVELLEMKVLVVAGAPQLGRGCTGRPNRPLVFSVVFACPAPAGTRPAGCSRWPRDGPAGRRSRGRRA